MEPCVPVPREASLPRCHDTMNRLCGAAPTVHVCTVTVDVSSAARFLQNGAMTPSALAPSRPYGNAPLSVL